MLPLLVVEYEARVRSGAEIECTAREFGVAARDRAGRMGSGRHAGCVVSPGLAHVVKCFGVHVLMPRRELREVGLGFARIRCQSFKRAIEHRVAITLCRVESGKIEVPARVVRHGGRVIERIGRGQTRRPGRAIIRSAQAPILLEPADMTDFPARRIGDADARPEFPRAAQVVGHGAQPRASGSQFRARGSGFHGAPQSPGEAGA